MCATPTRRKSWSRPHSWRLSNRAAFRGESTERTWLLGILRHKLADHARARHREYGAASSGNASVETHARDSRYDEHGSWLNRPARWSKNVNRSLESEEIWRDFENCLSRLPAGIAEAFVLREVRGISAPSACVELRISPENLWVRMHRARELLRKCLNGRWAVQKSRNPAVSLGGRPNDPRDRTELRGPAPTGSPVAGGAP